MSDSFVYEDWVYNFNAAKEVLPVILDMFKPNSILDVGCGTGTWLKVAQDLGVQCIFGLDDPRNDTTILKISEKDYLGIDLSQPFDLKKRFDLILCLEVAEHLPSSSAEGLVSSLVQHSDVILFSAAIPGQGGQNHINEQWPEYWESKFIQYGFRAFDILRHRFWNNNKVDFWYRQNMILFSKNSLQDKLSFNPTSCNSYVHPLMFETKNHQIKVLEQLVKNYSNPGIKKAFSMLLEAIFQRFK